MNTEMKYYGNEENYPKYEDYDAINVNHKKYIPKDYYSTIGVPITFLQDLSPNQFEIIGCCEPCIDLEKAKLNPKFKSYPSRQKMYEGKLCQKTYHRILIKRK